MTLESSEAQKSFLVSSSSCHAALPLFVRLMRTKHKMILKIIFYSPEFNRSIIVSKWTSMTKKIDEFLRHWKIGERIFCGSISVQVSLSNKKSCGLAGRTASLWFCFGLRSACKITCIQFKRIVFELDF